MLGYQNDSALAPADPAAMQTHWIAEIGRYERAFSSWNVRCGKILKRYRQQSSAANSLNYTNRYALLWANIETLKPAVYSQAPQAMASRRNKTADPVARRATEVVERALNYALHRADINTVLEMVRDDCLLCARGTAWVRYEADTEPQEYMVDPENTQPMDVLSDERVCVDYVPRDDFFHDPARFWDEVTWVARRVFLTKRELIERFGDAADGVGLDHTRNSDKNSSKDEHECAPKATVYEIWSKRDGLVFWIAKNGTVPLEVGPPHLDFDGFFPCPKPAYGTLTNEDLIPTPDYVFYQSQDEELDRLSRRVYALLDALKLIGFYPGGADEAGSKALQKAFRSNTENDLIPVPSWAAMGEKGQGIVWWPVEQVIKVLQGCYDARDRIVQQVYEITGLSDILRGSTDPNETLGAQQLKSQWGSIRVRARQNTLAQFAQSLYRLVGEIVAEVWQPETLAQASELEFDDQVVGLLRDGLVRNFHIEVQTDALAQPDEDAEKQRRVEFGTMFGQMIMQAQQALGGMPPQMAAVMSPVIGQAILFTVRGFKAGREMEDTVERAIDELIQLFQTQAQQPPPPDPRVAEVQGKMQLEQGGQQLDQAKLQIEAQHKAAMLQLEHRKLEMEDARHRDIESARMSIKTAPTVQVGADGSLDEVGAQLQAMAAAHGEALGQSQQGIAMAVQTLAQVASQIAAPKRVVRDANGRVAGVETVQ